MSTESDSDSPWVPPTGNPTPSSSSVTTRAQSRAINNNGNIANNNGNNSNNTSGTGLNPNAPVFDPNNINVIDSGLDADALLTIYNKVARDPPPDNPPILLGSVIHDDDTDTKDEFDSVYAALVIQVPNFDWDKEFERLVWLTVSDGEINRVINRGNKQWSFDDFEEYRQRRHSVISDLDDSISAFLLRCTTRQEINRARKALELLTRSYDVLKLYAGKPGAENFDQLKVYIDLFDKSKILFNKFANKASGYGNMSIREFLTDLSEAQFNLKFPGGFEVWSRFLRKLAEIGVPKPHPKPRGKKRSRKVSFDPNILPTLPTIEELSIPSNNQPPTLSSIIDQLGNPNLPPGKCNELRSQLLVIQQQLNAASEAKGYNTANATKSALENDGKEGDLPPKKKQKLSNPTQERLGSISNLATQQVL